MAVTNRHNLVDSSQDSWSTPSNVDRLSNRPNQKASTNFGWYKDQKKGIRYNRDERSFLNYCKAIYLRDTEVLGKVYGSPFNMESGAVVKNAMAEASGQTGGYTVPPDYTTKLLMTFAENSFIYPRALVIPMGSATCDAPRIDVETVPNAKGISPFFGQINFKWGSEQAPTETEPQFRNNELHAWDLLGYCVVSNQWLWDIQSSHLSASAESYLYRLFAKAAAWAAEYAFIQGTGSAQQMPQGMLNAACAIPVPRQTGGTITAQDIATMASDLLPFSWSSAIWLSSPGAVKAITQISQFTINRPVWDDDGNRNPSAGAILTMPWYVTEKLPDLGTTGDLMLVDPALYVIGDRMQVTIDVSPHSLFRTAQTVFRIWLRLDGMPIISNKITLQDTSKTVSSVVYLK